MKHSTLLMICFFVFFANAENRNDNEITEDKFSRIENELMNVISRVQSVENEKNELRSEMTNLENENYELRSKMKKFNAMEDEFEHLKEDMVDEKDEVAHLKEEMEDENDEIKRLKEKMEDEVALLKEEMEDENDEIERLKEKMEDEVESGISFRTCDEMYDSGYNESDYYLIDPDGFGNGEAAIRVYCDFTDDYGVTNIPHDSEEMIEVTHCKDPGCYSRPIIYDSPMEQIKNLIELSESCKQLIRYDCYLSPLETDGVTFGWWVDQNGEDQIYWTGSYYGNHVCDCHYSMEGCISDDILNNTCNCDSKSPVGLFDEGSITNSSALPIMELKFGGMNYESQLGFHTLGRLSCRGKVGDCDLMNDMLST